MKLASYSDGSRDGQLVVVSRDLSTAHYASGIAGRLQQVLDDWNSLSPQLEDLYRTLNHGKARHAFAFEPARCLAPLPRACQRAGGSAYLAHVERLHRARGAALPERLDSDPLLYQGSGGDLLGAHAAIVGVSVQEDIDFGAELAVVTGDVALGSTPESALEAVRLVMLANQIALRAPEPGELARGCGFVQSRPATAFSPVAVTPDELGSAWQGGRVHLTLEALRNGKRVGRCETGPEMHFHFGQLIAHLARTRRLRAGSIVGSGTVSNRDASHGHCCITEQRAGETMATGAAQTAFLQFGDTIRIEMKGADGTSLCGAIEQTVAALQIS